MITVSIDKGVQLILMDRPEARNALQAEDYVAMHRAFNEASRSSNIGAVVVTGAGGTFCGGQDLKDLGQPTPENLASLPFHAYIEALARCTKPVVGAVEGTAVGVGFTMLLHMDFVISASDASFRAPFVTLGATAEAGSSLLMQSIFGPRLGGRLLLTAEWLKATDPGAAGLVTEITSPGSSLATATDLARRLCALPRHSVESTKRLLIASREDAVMNAFGRERAELVRIAGLIERGEATAAFATGKVSR